VGSRSRSRGQAVVGGAEPLDAVAVREFCQRKLAHFKVPRYLHVVDDFPTTVTGKVRKVEMRADAVELLGLDDIAADTNHA
jgi:fatty-acyl-CoA synthase